MLICPLLSTTALGRTTEAGEKRTTSIRATSQCLLTWRATSYSELLQTWRPFFERLQWPTPKSCQFLNVINGSSPPLNTCFKGRAPLSKNWLRVMNPRRHCFALTAFMTKACAWVQCVSAKETCQGAQTVALNLALS